MNEEKATLLPKISWYLIARNGDLSSRVCEGMTLGEDAGGYLSMIPGEAIVELGIEDGRLLLEVISDAHELELAESERTRSVRVSPHDSAMVRFPNNDLLIDTSFARTNPYSETLTVNIVPVGNTEPVAADETVIAEGDAADGQEMVVPEVTAGEVTPAPAPVEPVATVEPAAPPESPGSATETSRQRVQTMVRRKGSTLQAMLPARVGAAGAFVVAAIISFLYFGYLTSDKPREPKTPTEQVARSEPIQVTTPKPGAPAVSPVEAVVEPMPGEQSLTEADAPQFQPPPAGQESIADEEPSSPQNTGAENLEAVEEDALLPSPEPESLAAVELLVDVPALFGGEQTPSETTIDFALRSLQALMIAYPDDDAVMQNLQDLTDRLLTEARLNYDLGDVAQAERLVKKASTTGTSGQAIADLASYFESTSPGTLIVETGRPPPSISPTVMVIPRDPIPVTSAENVFADLAEGFRAPTRSDTASLASADVESAALESPAVPTLKEVLPGEIYPFADLTAVSLDPPVYPKRALPGTEGVVELEFVVTDSGDVDEIMILGEPPGLFVRAARRAVQNWKFVPVERAGKPIRVRTSVRVAFRSGE
jgi:protein TonB